MKHIKKSMFISTVLMVVMLIAALSTATFAWYTSNNSVTSTATQVGAAQSKSANIGIGWYRTATASTITFDALVDASSNNQGGMYPMMPNAYYEKMVLQAVHEDPTDENSNIVSYTDIADTNSSIGDAYVASPVANVSSGIIAGAFGSGKNSKRIVNLNATLNNTVYENASVKAKASFYHDVTPQTDKIITNLKASDFTGNYQIVYTSKKYAYNNGINTVANAPAAEQIITLNAKGEYTVETPDTNDTACYVINKVYSVVADNTGFDSIDAAVTANSNLLTQYGAYSATGVACNPDTYVVEYIKYNIIPFNAIKTVDGANVTTVDIKDKIDTSVIDFVGYAADAEKVANDGDIYKTAAIATSGDYKVNSDINWNSDGFAYLYKIYDSTTNKTILQTGTGENNYKNFKFTQANIDASDFFKSTTDTAVEPAAYWNDVDGYKAAYKKPALITTRDTTVNAGTVPYFYVVNNSTDGDALIKNLTVNLTVTGDNADLLRIAVFKNGKYFGTLGRTEATRFGTIIEGANSNDLPTYNAVTSIELGTLASGASNAFQIQLVAWFDGKGLDDTAAGKNCSFTLSFVAEE